MCDFDWKFAAILLICVPISIVLYLLQNQFAWLGALISILVIIANLTNLARHLIRRRDVSRHKIPEIHVTREYSAGRITWEDIQFKGSEAVARYVNGLSVSLTDRTVSGSEQISEAASLIRRANMARQIRRPPTS